MSIPQKVLFQRLLPYQYLSPTSGFKGWEAATVQETHPGEALPNLRLWLKAKNARNLGMLIRQVESELV